MNLDPDPLTIWVEPKRPRTRTPLIVKLRAKVKRIAAARGHTGVPWQRDTRFNAFGFCPTCGRGGQVEVGPNGADIGGRLLSERCSS